MSASFVGSPPFPDAARSAVRDSQLRANLAHATQTIRAKRNRVIAELPDFEELRLGAESVKNDALGRLDELLEQFEENIVALGGHVHYARDAAEANAIITGLVRATGVSEVVKIKSMTTAEIGLNEALEAAGIDARETDLAELIVQLGNDLPSHIVVPAIHRNRAEIRTTFVDEMHKHGVGAPDGLTDEPAALAGAARTHLRDHFLGAKVAISGANFAIAETGSLVIVESEGNGRMCLTLADTLISVVGIDKVIPRFEDLEIFLQLLARSATGERMNPYTSIWTGPVAGDGPSEMHIVLLDNGRSHALADTVGRQALRCIRCAACLNVCPVYERVGGHAYGSVYPGPIGAVLTPQLNHVATDPVAASLPYASTLCGACFEVCPVRIDIPRLLVHLRGEVVDHKRATGISAESAAMAVAGYVFEDAKRLRFAERLASQVTRTIFRRGRVGHLPGPLSGWTDARDAPVPAAQSFRDWWLAEHDGLPSPAGGAVPSPAGGADPSPAGGADPSARSVPRGASPVSNDGPAWRALLQALLPTTKALRRGARVITGGGADAKADDDLVAKASRLAMPDGREAVLTAVTEALGPREGRAPAMPASRGYVRAGERPEDPAALLALLTDRLVDYKAKVWHVQPEGIAEAIASALGESGARSVVTPTDLPRSWLSSLDPEVRVMPDTTELTPGDLDQIDATVSASAVAIAETGTIILDGGSGQGRRVISLVPDHLVVVVQVADVVSAVPDAIAALTPTTPQTWISGPSATSDIELSRVEGVHGPRRLDVVLVGAQTVTSVAADTPSARGKTPATKKTSGASKAPGGGRAPGSNKTPGTGTARPGTHLVER